MSNAKITEAEEQRLDELTEAVMPAPCELFQGLLPAAPGWELLIVVFGKDLNAPELYRIPIIGWNVGLELTLPIVPTPWSRPSSRNDIVTEGKFRAYLTPDGSVVGYHLLEEPGDLQSFVDVCTRQEEMRRQYDKNPDKDPIESPLPKRFSR